MYESALKIDEKDVSTLYYYGSFINDVKKDKASALKMYLKAITEGDIIKSIHRYSCMNNCA